MNLWWLLSFFSWLAIHCLFSLIFNDDDDGPFFLSLIYNKVILPKSKSKSSTEWLINLYCRESEKQQGKKRLVVCLGYLISFIIFILFILCFFSFQNSSIHSSSSSFAVMFYIENHSRCIVCFIVTTILTYSPNHQIEIFFHLVKRAHHIKKNVKKTNFFLIKHWSLYGEKFSFFCWIFWIIIINNFFS